MFAAESWCTVVLVLAMVWMTVRILRRVLYIPRTKLNSTFTVEDFENILEGYDKKGFSDGFPKDD